MTVQVVFIDQQYIPILLQGTNERKRGHELERDQRGVYRERFGRREGKMENNVILFQFQKMLNIIQK